MQSELELQIEYDMYINGFDPTKLEDIIKYWNERLEQIA
jgi:hypothetical protein